MNKIYYNILKKEIKKLLSISLRYNYQNEIEYKLKKQYINLLESWVDEITVNFYNRLVDNKRIDFGLIYNYSENISLINHRDIVSKKRLLFLEYIMEINPEIDFNYRAYDIYNYPIDPLPVPSSELLSKKLINDSIKIGLEGFCKIGIHNPNVQCWMNTGLQMLVSIPEIRYVLLKTNIVLTPINIKQMTEDVNKINLLNLLKLSEENNVIKENINNTLKKNTTEKIILSLQLLIQNLLQDPKKRQINLTHIRLNTETISDIYYAYFAKYDVRYGMTDDTTHVMDIINLFKYPNANLLELYNILTHEYITYKQCPKNQTTSKPVINRQEYITITFEKSRKFISLQDYFDKYKNPVLNTTKEWNDCENSDYFEYTVYNILPETKYLFIRVPTWMPNPDPLKTTNNPIRGQDAITINPSIRVEGINFNLFGVCIYTGGHYVYQLYYGDGTLKILGLYDDSRYTPTPPESYLNINLNAYLVVYRRVD
jgi:ubiquitin C-terminal hydrolase